MKLIGAPSYIECSSKSQEARNKKTKNFPFDEYYQIEYEFGILLKLETVLLYVNEMQNVKGVFDAAIRVVLQPPKQKKKKGKVQKACSIL